MPPPSPAPSARRAPSPRRSGVPSPADPILPPWGRADARRWGRSARRPASRHRARVGPHRRRVARARTPRWVLLSAVAGVVAALVPARAAGGQEVPPGAAVPAGQTASPGQAVPAGPAVPGAYRPPVPGEPVDRFRPPEHPYGPGNRGFEYRTPPGIPVVAAGPGSVAFAGPVGGALHVTVAHADGLRTSYSFLAEVAVVVGQVVAVGEPVGTSSGVLHFGVRAGDRYLDPQLILAGGPVQVRLVPDRPPPAPVTEVVALWPLVQEAARGDGWALARHYLAETDLDVRLARVAREVAGRWVGAPPCTPEGVAAPRPAGERVAVLVGGHGSTGASASVDHVDTAALGYAAADVVRFSYAGGRVPGRPPDGPLAALTATDHDRTHSQGDLRVAAAHLRALLAEVAAARPGVPIDVYAHSQGGVVAQVALTEVVDGPALPAELDLVASLGAPHQGTDLATALSAVAPAPGGAAGLALLEAHLATGLDPDAPAVAQLSEVSPLLAAVDGAGPPPGVRLLAVAARGDLTVPAGHSRLWDAPRAVVDLSGTGAHGALPGHPDTTRELALALGGAPPTCTSALDDLLDAAVPEAISYGEDLLGAAAAALAWAVPD